MSHQDRPCPLVITHQTLKQVSDWLLAPAVFRGLRGHRQATWKPRLLRLSKKAFARELFFTARSIFASCGIDYSYRSLPVSFSPSFISLTFSFSRS